MTTTVTVAMSNNKTQIARFVGDAGAGSGPGVQFGNLTRKTCQRTAGSGTFSIEGSNDNVTFGPLGTAIAAINDAVCRPIPENPMFLRVVTAGAAATVIVVGNNS